MTFFDQLAQNMSNNGVAMITYVGNDDAISGEEDEGKGKGKGAQSAIDPPRPLFDTRPLEPDEETDEPVSGGGNPALMGNGATNSAQETNS